MIHHDGHHFRAYLIFFSLSIILIGSLVYFYAPTSGGLVSSSLANNKTLPVSGETVVINDGSESAEPLGEEERSDKRMRFTRLLLKYQADLQALEAEKMNTLGSESDPELDQNINSLTTRISNLENIITGLSD